VGRKALSFQADSKLHHDSHDGRAARAADGAVSRREYFSDEIDSPQSVLFFCFVLFLFLF